MDNWWKGYPDSNKTCKGRWVLKYGQEYCTKNNCNVSNLSFKMSLSNDLTRSMIESNSLLINYLKTAINEYVYQSIVNSYAHINKLMSNILWATTRKSDPNPECGTKYDKYLFNEIVILLNDLKSDDKFKSGIPLNYRKTLEQMFTRLSTLRPEDGYCHIENKSKPYYTGNTKIAAYDLNKLLSSRSYLFFNDDDIKTLYNPSNPSSVSTNVKLTDDTIATFNIEFNNIKYDIANKIKDIFNVQNNVVYSSAHSDYFIIYLFNVFGSISNNSRLFSNVFKKVLKTEQINNAKIQLDKPIVVDNAKITGNTGSTYIWLYSKPDATQIIDCDAAKLRGFVGEFENLNIDIQKGQTYSGMTPCEKNTALFFETEVNCDLRQLMSEKNIKCDDDIINREKNKNSNITSLCNK